MKKIFTLACAVALVSFASADMLDTVPFSKKCQFSVAGYTGTSTLSDFPVLVRLSGNSPTGFSYADCATDGSDLRFADPLGNSLPHEIDTWNPSGESLVWVKVPTLSGTGTAITAYYGAEPAALPAVNAREVWTKYVTVIHGGSSITDSSTNNLSLTANSVSGTQTGGVVGGGMNKPARNSIGVNIPNPYKKGLFTNNRQYSISFWAKSGTASDTATHVTVCAVSSWGGNAFLGLFEKNRGWSVAVSGQHHVAEGMGKLPANTWVHTAFSYDTAAGHLTSYANGESTYDDVSNVYDDANCTYWTLGGYANTGNNDNFTGDLDEFRIYDGIASADWVKAEYDSANNASFTVGEPVEDVEATVGANIACVKTVHSQTALAFDVMVTGFGEDASSCDLHAVLASDAEYLHTVDSFDKTASEVQLKTVYALGAENLHFGTPYYLKIVATNSKGETKTIEKTYETLPELPCSTTFALEKADNTFASFIWSLSSFGAISTYASVEVEWDTTDGFPSPSSQEVVAKLETETDYARTVIRGLSASQTYFVRLKTVNEYGIVGYSPVVSVTTASSAANTLVWANTGSDMNSASSWVELRVPTQNDTLFFVDKPVVQPQLTADLTVYSLQFNGLDNKTCSASGYDITAQPGATLTLKANYINQDTQYAVLGHFEGTNTIRAPVYFDGNKVNVGGSGMTLVFGGELSTKSDRSQEFNVSANKSGIVIFAHENPSFTPKHLYAGGSSHFGFTVSNAISSLTKLKVSSWAAGDDKTVRFKNLTGAEVSLPNLVELEMGDTDNFAVDGMPVYATNCVLTSSDRGTSMSGNTLFAVRKVVNKGNGNNFYMNCKDGAFMVTEDFVLADGQTSGPSICNNNGLYIPGSFARAFPTGSESHNRFNGDAGRKPILGITEDVSVKLAYNGGIFFGHTNGEDKDGGFAALGGPRHLTLLDSDGKVLDPVSMKQRPLDDLSGANKAWATPASLLVGNKWATGTVIFENNFSFPANNTVYAYQGQADVAGRFPGDLTVDASGHFYKNGDGALALEGTLTMGSGKELHIREGGLLVNTDLSDLAANIRLDSSAWIGGTGTVAHIHKESGSTTDRAAIRAGEFGRGTLTVTGTKNSKFAANTGIIVDITKDGSCGLLKLQGDLSTYSSGWSGYWMQVNVAEGAPAGRYKIMDWSEGTGTPTKIMTAEAYEQILFDTDIVQSATLSVEGSAMYLELAPRGSTETAGAAIFVF